MNCALHFEIEWLCAFFARVLRNAGFSVGAFCDGSAGRGVRALQGHSSEWSLLPMRRVLGVLCALALLPRAGTRTLGRTMDLRQLLPGVLKFLSKQNKKAQFLPSKCIEVYSRPCVFHLLLLFICVFFYLLC